MAQRRKVSALQEAAILKPYDMASTEQKRRIVLELLWRLDEVLVERNRLRDALKRQQADPQ